MTGWRGEELEKIGSDPPSHDLVAMVDRPVEHEQRVTPLELFFDLVVVFAITQVTELMSNDPSWRGVGHGLLVLAAIWWLWTGYAWLTNSLEPEQAIVRAGMFAAMAAMFLVALAVPGAFGDEGVLFAVAYLVVRLIYLALYGVSARGDRSVSRALMRFATREATAPVLILAAAFVDGPWRDARAHPGRPGAASARLPRACGGGVLRADRVGSDPLSRGPRRGPTGTVLAWRVELRLHGRPDQARCGGQGRDRTADLAVFSRTLYRLSYLPRSPEAA